jgi:hypothetical protein
MAVSIDFGTSIITVPKADLTLLSAFSSGFSSGFGAGFGSFAPLYKYDLNTFRLALKDIEDSAEGMPFPNTHAHNTTVVLGGLALARVIEVLPPYTVTFEDGQYAVNLVGANSNVAERTNVNSVSVKTNNSAGLIVVTSGSGLSGAQDAALTAIKSKTDQLAFTVVNQVDANTKSIKDQPITGSGTPADPWGP